MQNEISATKYTVSAPNSKYMENVHYFLKIFVNLLLSLALRPTKATVSKA